MSELTRANIQRSFRSYWSRSVVQMEGTPPFLFWGETSFGTRPPPSVFRRGFFVQGWGGAWKHWSQPWNPPTSTMADSGMVAPSCYRFLVRKYVFGFSKRRFESVWATCILKERLHLKFITLELKPCSVTLLHFQLGCKSRLSSWQLLNRIRVRAPAVKQKDGVRRPMVGRKVRIPKERT